MTVKTNPDGTKDVTAVHSLGECLLSNRIDKGRARWPVIEIMLLP